MTLFHRWSFLAGLLLFGSSSVLAQTTPSTARPTPAPNGASKSTKTTSPPAASPKTESAQNTPTTAVPEKVPDDTVSLSAEARSKEIKKNQKTYEAFRAAAQEYLDEVRALVRKRYRERRNLIAGGFEARIQVLEKRETLKRQTTIAYFKAFLEKYPNDPAYSPDAIYRLAELIYEKEYEEYLARAGRYEEDLKRFENKEISEEPSPAKKLFSETVSWLQKLTNEFPRYRLLANAYYLLGYCRGEEENTKEALVHFAKIPELDDLKKKNPAEYAALEIPTNLVAEAWVRLGEFYFRENRRQEAKDAYQRVLAYPKLEIYDKALYKLAWTHYLLDEFQPAVDRFTELLEFYIKTGKLKAGSDLRQEAIEYIAISFADERWSNLDKAIQYVRQIGLTKPYARDVLVQLSKNYGLQGKWNMVIATNEKLLELFPDHAENPVLQQQTVDAWRRLGDLNKAMLARADLSKRFGPGTRWAQVNERNLRAQRMVQKIVSHNIYRTALYNHTRCDTLRKESEKDAANKDRYLAEAQTSCNIAADNYVAFLQKFPHHKEAYKLTWYLADSLYFTKRYKEAAVYFKKIRDWTGESEYRQEAAFSLVDSHIQLVNQACRERMIQLGCELPEDTKKEQETPKPGPDKKRAEIRRRQEIKEIPITHEAQKELVQARMYFTSQFKNTDDKRVPEQMYLLARLYYQYDQFENARKLLWEFVKRYTSHKYKKFAAETIVATYYREGRDEDMLQAMDELQKYSVEVKGAGMIRLGVAFRKAERLEKENKYAEAAKAYVEIIDKNPNIPKAAAALWNAAYLYSRAQRFGSAITLYERIVRDYPTWDKADQALFNVAYNAEKYFLFEKALERYRKLVEDQNFSKSKFRPDALYNVAQLQLNLQRYEEAAQTYIRYSNQFQDRNDAPEMLYNAAMIYKRTNRNEEMIRILRLFIRRYESNDEQVRRVMQAYGHIMEHQEKQGLSDREMQREYKKIVDVFQRLSSRMKPVDIAQTRQYPAKAAYQLVMVEYKRFLNIKVESLDPKRQVKERDQKAKEYDRVASMLSDISKYQSPPWVLCAMYRIAEGKQKIAEAINKAPLPRIRGVKWTEEAKDLYKQNLDEKLIQPLEKSAIDLYRKAIAASQKLNYENECVKQAYVALNRADPTVPLPKEDNPQFDMKPTAPLPLLRSLSEQKTPPTPPQTPGVSAPKPNSSAPSTR